MWLAPLRFANKLSYQMPFSPWRVVGKSVVVSSRFCQRQLQRLRISGKNNHLFIKTDKLIWCN